MENAPSADPVSPPPPPKQVGLSGLLGDHGQLPSEEQSNAGGGEGWIWGSHRTGPHDRDKEEKKKKKHFYELTPGTTHKERELERPQEDGETTEEVKEKRGYGY